MPFSFPASPTVGQQSTQNGRVYQWTGTAWELVATPAAIDGAAITTGTVAPARLASSGTASATTFLRGDQSWSSLPAGGSTNLWIPASAFIPRTTSGPGVDSRETSTNRQNFDEVLFDAAAIESADALILMPNNYNAGTITARFYWTASSGSNNVVWSIAGRAFADDDALDTAYGSAQSVTDTLLAANDMHVSAATSAITLGGTPAANRPTQITVLRDATNASDTLAVDARLLGVEIIYTAA